MNECLEKLTQSRETGLTSLRNFMNMSASFDSYHLYSSIKMVWTLTEKSLPPAKSFPAAVKSSWTDAKYRDSNFDSYLSFRAAAGKQDAYDYLVLGILLPIWYSCEEDSSPAFQNWVYQNLKTRSKAGLPVINRLLFKLLNLEHSIKVIDELKIPAGYNTEKNRQNLVQEVNTLMTKYGVGADEYLFRKQIPSKKILGGFICRLDSAIFDQTANTRLHKEILKRLVNI
uniref:Putative ATP synthase CF1 subunit delta n=1 Tax=Eustigmatophyceae sp. Chic 10/23 P-6w TaxID=1446905 RepID=A0A451FMD8_9STRA|nr:putative ATP synthase CF1 subunit delta [Eustigmatophyceae sp. Chic 10/23 P-6w]QAA11565.1 putative ATP synthase CF1 subunit delta [Eustigmatophyceae sp. Chic 10/23 P-6w]